MKEVRLNLDASVRRSEPDSRAQMCSVTYPLANCNLPEVSVSNSAVW